MDVRGIYFVVLSIGLTTQALHAAPFLAMDPRTLAMAGAGVSSSDSANAIFYNPALLAIAKRGEDFRLGLPVIAARMADPDKLRDVINELAEQNYIERFKGTGDAFNSRLNNQQLLAEIVDLGTEYVTISRQLRNNLVELDNKAVEAQLNTHIVLGVPSKKTGVAVTLGFGGSLGAVGNFSNNDIRQMDNAIDAVDEYLLFANDVLSGNASQVPDRPLVLARVADFNSNIEVRGAGFIDFGIALARIQVVRQSRIAVGITPIIRLVRTIDYVLLANDFDFAVISEESNVSEDLGFTLDFGFAKTYGTEWKTGLVIKNLIPQRYQTKLDNDIKINPAVRIGASHYTDWTTVSLDLDLSENDPIGIGGKTQYLALGAEFDVSRLQIRGGYRYNLSDNDVSVATFGFGLNFGGLHADLAIGLNGPIASSAEYSMAMQVGLKF